MFCCISTATALKCQEIFAYGLRNPYRFAFDPNEGATRFFINDDGGLSVESGRLRLLDDSGAVVAETTFKAGNTAGTHEVSLAWQGGFSAVELSAGAWDGTDFVFGAYDGGAPIATDGAGKLHGSDFLVDWVEFDFPIVGVPLPQNEV